MTFDTALMVLIVALSALFFVAAVAGLILCVVLFVKISRRLR